MSDRPPVRAVIALALAVLVVLTGCTGLFSQEQKNIGQEGGYNATDPVSVTTANGLNASEREVVVDRTMARVEAIRGLEFTSEVSVRVISRAEYRNQSGGLGTQGDPNYIAWKNQIWEALFLVSEPANVSNAMSSVYGSTVLGYYSNGKIVIVSDSETPKLDRATLAHELTHALQDQQLTLGGGRKETRDARLAENGLIEGDANYVENTYAQRCNTKWSCLPRPGKSNQSNQSGQSNESGTGSGQPNYNRGIYMTIVMPYVEGPEFIDTLYKRGGWEAINNAYEDIPESTEQIIHPSRYPDEDPETVTVEDRSTDEWNRFDDREANTLGEVSIYSMFWINGVIEKKSHEQFNYSHPLSTGWAGDSIVPYRNGDRYGYVWKTKWDTKHDATQFAKGYKTLLEQKNAQKTDGAYVVPEKNPYGDAFQVIRDGRTVTIVNAPTVDELDEVH
jgi:hypothetical protein